MIKRISAAIILISAVSWSFRNHSDMLIWWLFIFSVFLFFQNLGFFTYKVTTEPEIMAAVIIYFP